MTYFFQIGIGVMIVICQTAVFQQVGLFSSCYDLLIVQIIYLGLYCLLLEGIIIIALFGVAMDSLTGGPYGLYLIAYFWIFAGIRWALTYLRLSNTLMLPIVFAFAVVLENLVQLAGLISFGPSASTVSTAYFGNIIRQLIWAVLTGPLALVFLRRAYRHLVKWVRGLLVAAKKDQWPII